MANEHKLPYTAEEIETRLAGVGLPYFALTATTVEMGQEVELAEEDRTALTSVLVPMASTGRLLPIIAAIPFDGTMLTTVLTLIANTAEGMVNYGGNLFGPGYALLIGLSGSSSRYTIYVDEFDISGADTEAIAAELEGIVNGEY